MRGVEVALLNAVQTVGCLFILAWLVIGAVLLSPRRDERGAADGVAVLIAGGLLVTLGGGLLLALWLTGQIR
jgi:hypothetical protein